MRQAVTHRDFARHADGGERFAFERIDVGDGLGAVV
jgi:hypothetical protein